MENFAKGKKDQYVYEQYIFHNLGLVLTPFPSVHRAMMEDFRMSRIKNELPSSLSSILVFSHDLLPSRIKRGPHYFALRSQPFGSIRKKNKLASQAFRIRGIRLGHSYSYGGIDRGLEEDRETR